MRFLFVLIVAMGIACGILAAPWWATAVGVLGVGYLWKKASTS